MHDTPMSPLRIAQIEDAAVGIRSFELVHPAGSELPAFSPGAHVQVQVPNGEVRKYSLCNDPAERHRYRLAVKRDANGRGASLSLCDDAKVGDLLPVSAPSNAFPLVPSRGGYLFIAGGIGITPILSMIRSFGAGLRSLPPAPWKLVYLTRNPETTAFREELLEHGPRVQIHHDHGDPAQAFDLWPLLEKNSAQQVYCCGPQPLMDAVRDMTGHWPHTQVHFESFVDGGAAQAGDREFTVICHRSGPSVTVPVGVSILQALRNEGLDAPSSCESGTCGTCRTMLLQGEADHRDMVLMPEEQATQIMVCVSRAKSATLVLDL